MEVFILAGLLFHVGAAATLTLVSAIAGLRDAQRRAARCAKRKSDATIIAISGGIDSSHVASATHAASHYVAV